MYSITTNNKGKIRVVDEDGYVRRVAALCVSDSHDVFMNILLVTSVKSHSNWIIPSGGIDPYETAEQAVVREAFEEAGALCEVHRSLGLVNDHENKKRTEVFQMYVTEMLKDDECRENRLRCWFSFDEAYRNVSKYRPEHCKYLDLLRNK